MGLAGSQLKVRFFSITNIDGNLYAKFDVVRPKKVLCEDKIIDLSKLSEYSKSLKNGLFVGVEQRKRDSLYVPKNTTKTWSKAHVGYFNMFTTLLAEDNKIREVINVDGDWDGEWNQNDILNGLTEKQIQQKIDEYKNDPFIKGYIIMPKLFLEDATVDNFETKEFLNSFIQKCIKYGVAKEVYEHYIEYDIKKRWGGEVKKLLNYWDNDSILAEYGYISKENTNNKKLKAVEYPKYTVGVQSDREIDKIWSEWNKHTDERMELKKKMLLKWQSKIGVD